MKLTEEQLLLICRQQTNPTAVVKYEDTFLRIAKAVQESVITSLTPAPQGTASEPPVRRMSFDTYWTMKAIEYKGAPFTSRREAAKSAWDAASLTQAATSEPVGEIVLEGVIGVKFYENCEYGTALPVGTKLFAAPAAAHPAPSVKRWEQRYEEMGVGPSFNAVRRHLPAERMAMEAEIADLRAALSASSAVTNEDAKGPDMMWLADDPEAEYGDSAEEFAKDYAANCLRVGEVADVDVLCAFRAEPYKRTLRIGVTDGGDEDSDRVEWKWVDRAALASQGVKGGEA